jgi:hypothetical protein
MKYILTLIALVAFFPVIYGQQLIASLTEQWIDSSWQNNFYTTIAYNPDETEAVRTSQSFETGEWLNNSQSVTVYDAEGRPETVTDLSWDGTGWGNAFRRTYTYVDLTDNVLTTTTAVWMDNEYKDFSRVTRTYDSFSGLPVMENIDLKDQLSGNWYHVSSYEYTNNAEGEIVQQVYSIWDNLLSWVPERRFTRAYTTSGDVQLNFEEVWVDNEWINSRMQHFVYDTDGLLQNLLIEEWNEQTESWQNALGLDYTYNSDGTLYQVLNKKWLGSDWQNHYRITHTYGTAYLGIAESQHSPGVFPNPATDQLTILFAQKTTATVRITSMEGEILETQTVSGIQHQVAVNTLPAGIYLVTIQYEDQLETHRIVKR